MRSSSCRSHKSPLCCAIAWPHRSDISLLRRAAHLVIPLFPCLASMQAWVGTVNHTGDCRGALGQSVREPRLCVSGAKKPDVFRNAHRSKESSSEGLECACELASICRDEQNIVIQGSWGKDQPILTASVRNLHREQTGTTRKQNKDLGRDGKDQHF